MSDSTTQQTQSRAAAEIEAELEALDTNTNDLHRDDSTQPEAPTAGDAADIHEAGRKGWVPKDQYKKDPASWVDAKTFLQRGDRFVSNLQREVDGLKQKLSDFEGTKAAFVKFSEETLAKKDSELKEAISALRVQRSQATREGDDELAVQLEDRIELLRDQRVEVKTLPEAAATTTKPAGPDNNDLVLREWVSEGNEWFDTEPKLRDFAVAMGEQMIAGGETTRGRRFLDKIAAAMAIEFPRRFKAKDGAPRNNAAESSNANTGNATGGNGGKTERDLPKEDLAMMRELIADGYTTKEKFLASYYSRN